MRVLRGGRGLVPSLNAAASAARAPLLARMDADDVARPGRLERQLSLLDARPGLAACGAGVRYRPRDRVGPGYRRYERWINGLHEPAELRRDLFVECPVPHPTLVIRRSVHRALGGYRDAGWPEDYDLLLRLHAAGMQAANLDAVLLEWRLHDENRSRGHPAYSPESFLRCKLHFLTEVFLPPDRPLVIWGAGRRGKPLGRALAEEGRGPRAWVDLDPARVGERIHGAPVLDPTGFREAFPAAGGPADAYVLGAVGAPGAREEIREALAATGRVELRDYRMVA